MKTDNLSRPKELQLESMRLRRAVSDLALDTLILKDTARGTVSAPPNGRGRCGQADPAGHRRERGQQRPALHERLVRRAEAADLDQEVHDRKPNEAVVLRPAPLGGDRLEDTRRIGAESPGRVADPECHGLAAATVASMRPISSGARGPAAAAATHSASSRRFFTPSTRVSMSSDSA